MNPHDYVSIRGQGIRHSTAARDWLCGVCGSGLVTKWDGGWVTVCANDASHPADEFIHRHSVAYLEHKALLDAAIAQDVLDHLPDALKEAINDE